MNKISFDPSLNLKSMIFNQSFNENQVSNIESWSIEDILEWLTREGFEEYQQIFRRKILFHYFSFLFFFFFFFFFF